MASSQREIETELRRQLLADPEVQGYAHKVAADGADYARKISPVGDTPAHEHHPGPYGAFKGAWSMRDLPAQHDQPPGAQIRNDDPGAVSIEYGTHDTPPHHTLQSTITYLEQQFGVELHPHWTAPGHE